MADLPQFRVYISSTIDDLAQERADAMDVIKDHAQVVHSYRAGSTPTVENCVRDVRSTHLYVCIIGRRYGWVVDSSTTGKSITETEYDACLRPDKPPIPRLVFLRTLTPDAQNDQHDAKFSEAERASRVKRLEAFRTRASTDQQPIEFTSTAKLREKLLEALIDKRDRYHREQSPGRPIFEQSRPWQSRLHPVALLAVAGQDEAWRKRLVDGHDRAFRGAVLDLARADLALQVEAGTRHAQLACLLVTSTTLGQVATAARQDAMAQLLAVMRCRYGCAAVVCVGIDPASLPAEWQPFTVLQIDKTELQQAPTLAATKLFDALKQHASLSTDTRLAVPYMVIAPTAAELAKLTADPKTAFAEVEDSDVRRQRLKQFDEISRAARTAHDGWPAQVYVDSRDGWRCFGAGAPTAGELLRSAIASINAAHPGARERELLQRAELVPRRYDLDEYLNDVQGSRQSVEAMCRQGGLLLVDETALLHPRLRDAARALLVSQRSAIATLCASDPVRWPLKRLLGEQSYLRVGSVVDRFQIDKDLLCELALNSQERLERWLRSAIPRLLADVEGLASHPGLLSRMDDELR